MAKHWKEYQCVRCNIKRGVTKWVFSEDGFIHNVFMCSQCAEETGIYGKTKEYLRNRDNKNGNTNTNIRTSGN